MPKIRLYKEEDKAVALAFFDRVRDIDEAAKRANVEPAALRSWIAGAGIEHPAASEPEVLEIPDLDDYAFDLDDDDVDGALMQRPMPEDALADIARWPILCSPAHELMEWIRACFIDESGPLFNHHHLHLQNAKIGAVWMNAENTKGGKFIGGKAKLTGQLTGDKWNVAAEQYQLIRWFGHVPDFTLYFDAPYCYEAPDRSFGALVDHELYHCGIKKKDGAPKFAPDGTPIWAIIPHDAEEFVGVARRFGVGACAAGVAELVYAASLPPELTEVDIRAACGT